MKTSVLETTALALQTAYGTMADIAAEKGADIKTVSVNVAGTDLGRGTIKGTVTVKNRSRRPFTLQVHGSDVLLTLLGVTRKVA